MARGKGPKRGGGRRFAAESAEEIEQRNARLAEFDEQRAKHRAEAAEDGEGDDDDSSEAMLVNSMTNNATIDDDNLGEKDRKAKGLEGLIEVDNPNTQPVRMMKAKDLATAAGPPDVTQMTRKQREEYEREQKAAAYRKRHEAGLTEEYRRDMEKLAEVKARREKQAQARKDREEAEKKLEEERKKAAEAAGASGDGKKSKKKSSSSKKSGPPKLDKITIKKMKPTQLKEALKERGLDIQGNAKVLTERLLKYEAER
eukprot:CAMPEP_0196811384 /NCGR_PEP_ID=MMETSP1362-20130617/17113_1 /TAXON_ID=163516 /ORGANISM="Leptocylindrus danicus, Strain CCMP1856" /LENGTH=256 /DNA_ID=CAMNT_0042186671 /DNA_START=50 /DNA_END=820 /DNA_ORIENTATION=+